MTPKKRFLITVLWLFLAGSGGTFCMLSGMYLYLSPQLPSVDSLRDVKLQTPLRVYSADGKLMAEFGEKRRTPIKFDQIPSTYVDALLAAEDDNFFEHGGVSIKGLLRAASQLVLTGHRASGGSTITMQVARNYYLSRRKTFARKFNEILLALRIEKELSKEEILELYVNVIFLGNRAYGIAAASQVYYGKPLSQLSLAQSAMLAGLPKGPSTMNPIANPPRALARRNWILGRMLSLEKIDEAAYAQAIEEPVTAQYHGSIVDINAPYISEMARAKAIELYGLKAYTNGYRIYTTIDSVMQERANHAVVNGLLTYDSRHGYRGPERTLNLLPTMPGDQVSNLSEKSSASSSSESSVSSATAENDAPTIDDSEIDFSPLVEAWQKQLNAIPIYGNLIPAAVALVKEKSLIALLPSGQTVELQWDQGLSSARPYINENAVGAAPKNASDVVAVGDVIRLAHDDTANTYKLSQVPAAQAALIALKPQNGGILSLVGGFDFRQSHFNRATQAERQPGSNFKPFIYTAAIEHGMTPATIINDSPIDFFDSTLEDTWRPKNSDGRFLGPMRLREALYRSRNLVSIRVLRETGIGNTIRGMSRFGFNEKAMPRDLSLALGSYGLRPIDVATGYAVFANGGYKVQPYLIERILDNQGQYVYQAMPATACPDCQPPSEKTLVEIPEDATDTPSELQQTQEFSVIGDPFEIPFSIKRLIGTLTPQDFPRAEKVLDDRVNFIVDSILKDVIRRGTGRRARSLNRSDIAGKTGTTNDQVDAWFSGYNRDVVATTWVGFDQNTPLGHREYGGRAALPIWISFMETALKNSPETAREQPTGIVSVRIDPETGARARPGDPDAVFEYFRSENAPQEIKQNPDVNSPYRENEERITEDLF